VDYSIEGVEEAVFTVTTPEWLRFREHNAQSFASKEKSKAHCLGNVTDKNFLYKAEITISECGKRPCPAGLLNTILSVHRIHFPKAGLLWF
jgi:hypothetical protein